MAEVGRDLLAVLNVEGAGGGRMGYGPSRIGKRGHAGRLSL